VGEAGKTMTTKANPMAPMSPDMANVVKYLQDGRYIRVNKSTTKWTYHCGKFAKGGDGVISMSNSRFPIKQATFIALFRRKLIEMYRSMDKQYYYRLKPEFLIDKIVVKR
jgi:hypothetical protein